jgi:hypothetical protein
MAKKDWTFTEDGDLVLGDPRTDTDGNVLYLHNDGTIDTNQAGDGREIRDLDVSSDLDAEKQIIFNRLRTDAPDWYAYPALGGNLTDLIGEPNTRDTASRGAAYIQAALTFNSLYDSSQVNVRPVPISQNEILFMIEISRAASGVFRLPLTFNLVTGLMDEYVPTT